MPPNSTTVLFENPEKASWGVKIPQKARTMVPDKAATAIGMYSVTNKKATEAKTIKVMIAGSVKEKQICEN